MQRTFNPQELAGLAFQVDLLNLNLNLAEKERTLTTEKKANEAALVEIRALSKQH